MQSALCGQSHAVQRPMSLVQQDQLASTRPFEGTCKSTASTLLSRKFPVHVHTRQNRTSTAVSCSSTPEALAKHAAEQSDKIPENEQGHAVLHDFCMGIPYGSILLAAGIVSLLFGSGQQGVSNAIGGAAVLASAVFSLVQWKQGHPPSTLRARLPQIASAGFTVKLVWDSWTLRQAGIAAVPNTAVFGLSLAMLVFLLYNIFAGGNPPKKADLDDTQPAKSAAPA